MKYSQLFLSAICFFSCSVENKESDKEGDKHIDTVYYEVPVAVKPADITYPEFKKPDNSILTELFICDTVYSNGFVGWYPSADDVYASAAGASLCSTNLETVHYFKKAQADYAFCLLVTYDEFAKGGYHASAPYVGGALFRKKDTGFWKLEMMKKLVTTHGEMGYLKPYAFVNAGLELPLLQLSFSYTATGETTEEEHFFELFELREVFSMKTGGGYAAGSELDHNWDSEIHFKRDPQNKYYDLLTLRSKGTEYNHDLEKIISIDTIRIFRYNDFRWMYEPVCE